MQVSVPGATTNRKQVVAWAFYDWANSAFALSIMTVFFPIFLGEYWIAENSGVNSTVVLGSVNAVGSFVIVLLAPIIGAIADSAGARKRYLAFFAFTGASMSAGLFFVGQGDWQIAAALFMLGVIGFSGANVFYDALLVSVARPARRDLVSAIGFAFGYLGGSVLFIVNVLMYSRPEWFGLDNQIQAIRIAYLGVGAWWALFTIPVLLFVQEESRPDRLRGWSAVTAGWRQLLGTLRKIRSYREVWMFLLAYWLYIDGVDTIIRMAVDFGRQLGFETADLITAILFTNLVGFPATLLYGKLGERTGAKAGILLGLFVYILLSLASWFITQAWHFYVLAFSVGLVQGGVQALSRSLYSRIIPQSHAGEFFGFYNMLGKFAAVLGPLLVAWTSAATGSPHASIVSIVVLFVAGGGLLLVVKTGSENNCKTA